MTQKAKIAQVKIGTLTVEGLMADDGIFGVAVPQIVATFQIDQSQATRTIKRALSKEFQIDQSQTHLLQWKTKIHPGAVNVLTLDQFGTLALSQYGKGNQFVDTLVRSLFGLSLHQLWADAFGLKFEVEERQQYLEGQLATLDQFASELYGENQALKEINKELRDRQQFDQEAIGKALDRSGKLCRQTVVQEIHGAKMHKLLVVIHECTGSRKKADKDRLEIALGEISYYLSTGEL